MTAKRCTLPEQNTQIYFTYSHRDIGEIKRGKQRDEKQKGRITDGIHTDMNTYMTRQKYAWRDRDTGNSHEDYTERYNRKRYRQRGATSRSTEPACPEFSHMCPIKNCPGMKSETGGLRLQRNFSGNLLH